MHRIILPFFLFLPLLLIAQEDLKFERYNVDNGLQANYILDIAQDSIGFMWFGMRGGCCRFDGFKFKTFPIYNSSGNVKLNGWTSKIFADKDSNLWISQPGSQNILKFDYDKEVFINHYDNLKLPEEIKKNIAITTFFCDSKGQIWLGTAKNGVVRYDPISHETEYLFQTTANDSVQYKGYCRIINEDKEGNIWIGSSHGIFKYNPINKNFIFYRHDSNDPKSLGGKSLTAIYVNSENIIWVGIDNGGLNKYNRTTDNFRKYFHDPDNQNSLSHNSVYSITEDMQKRLWVGTLYGLCIMDKNTGTFKRYFHDETNLESLNSNLVRVIFPDRTGNVWIGTGEGIAKLKLQKFVSYRQSALKNSISQNKVQYLFEDQGNNIWISTPKGIDIFNRKTEQFQFFAGVTRDEFGLHGAPLCFCEQPGKGMWIGSYLGGLSFYDYNSKRFTTYLPDPEDAETIATDFVTSLLLNNNLLYIGLWGKGLDIFDLKTKKFTHFQYDSENKQSIPSNDIQTLYQDSQKHIWLGTSKGVALFETPEKGVFRRIEVNSSNKVIYSIAEAKGSKDCYWFGSMDGLIRYNMSSNKYVIYNESNGFPFDKAFGILNDNSGNIWVSTERGLIKLLPDYSSTDSIVNFRVFHKSDGLQGKEFVKSSYCKTKDGTMLFGGTSIASHKFS